MRNSGVFFLILLLGFIVVSNIFSGYVLAQTPPEHPGWDVQDQNGLSLKLQFLPGHLNVHSKLSSTNPQEEGEDFDSLANQAEAFKLNFIGINDTAVNISLRTFSLIRGLALAKAKTDQAVLPGFNWIGDPSFSMTSLASIVVVGADNIAYYSAGGSEISVPAVYRGLDYISPDLVDAEGTKIYTSENDYINIIKNGTFLFQSSGKYNSIITALNSYVEKWQDEYDFNLVLGGETLEELRKDMENKLEEVNNSENIRVLKFNYDNLASWINTEASQNEYICAMFCYPVGTDSVTDWAKEFFTQKFNAAYKEAFALAEVKGVSGSGGSLDSTLYQEALSAGWKVSPATSLNNTGPLVEQDTELFTGIWSEIVTSSSDQKNYILKMLQAIKKRRTWVSNLKTLHPKLWITDVDGQTLAIMGETVKRNKPGLIELNMTVAVELNDKIFIGKPIMVVIYKDKSVRYFPFTSFYQDVYGTSPQNQYPSRVYQRHIDSFKNIECFYVRVDYYRIMQQYNSKRQYENDWSFYKIWKYFQISKLNAERFQLVTAPIFIDID